MKVAYGSDIHLEFYGYDKQFEIMRGWKFEPDTDRIIIAGDLHVGAEKVIDCLKFIWKAHKIPILYVPGNHEYYNSSFDNENLLFLHHDLVHDGYRIFLHGYMVVDDVMFYGCMGNLDGSYEKINRGIHGSLNDFHLISDFSSRIARGCYEKIRLENSLSHAIYERAVVITHTMPSPKCISEQYRGSYLNGAFANDWEDMITQFKPKYWVCGHTHDIGNVRIDETDILINPMGYPRENKKWEWRYFNV